MTITGLQSWSRKEWEVFGWSWSRITNNTRSQSWILKKNPTLTLDLQLDIFYITLLNWELLLKWYNFFSNFCWNRILAVHHDFHWF